MLKNAVIALIISVFVLPFHLATAQDNSSTPLKIAVINVQAVEKESVAWKSLSDQINSRREKLKNEIQNLQSTLEEKAKSLDAQRALLSAEAFATEVNNFKKERASLDQAARSRKQNLDKAYLEARNQIRNALNKVLVGFVKQENITLLLKFGEAESTVYYALPTMFIDKLVLELLDKEIQTVKLPVEAPAQ